MRRITDSTSVTIRRAMTTSTPTSSTLSDENCIIVSTPHLFAHEMVRSSSHAFTRRFSRDKQAQWLPLQSPGGESAPAHLAHRDEHALVQMLIVLSRDRDDLVVGQGG